MYTKAEGRRQRAGGRRQDSGDRIQRLPLFILPSPHTPHPPATPVCVGGHTPHPTPHTLY
ncbi:MAG: hypothetical protein DWQ58_16740 [Microcystis aeruginosa TA09]|nr:MAG: hypothetical protein DWQ58_16740 [Microcystis aeruginosa TA09]